MSYSEKYEQRRRKTYLKHDIEVTRLNNNIA